MKKNNLVLILVALASADLLGAIDSTALNVALPKITSTLNIPISLAQWIPNALTLALIIFLIFMGKLGDKVGPKKLYLAGLGLFGLSSLVLGFVSNIELMITLRAIQGIAIAILYTMPMAIIAHLWKEREKAFAVTSGTFAAGMLVGPIVGGALANINIGQFYGWHLLFLINVPLVIAGLIVSAKYIPDLPANREIKLDYASVALLALGLTTIALSLAQINKLFLFVGFLFLIILYFYQKRSKNSLLDFHLFRSATFSASNIISFVIMVSVIGMSFVLTFYLQNTLGWSPIQAGLALLPIPIFTGIFSAVGGQLKNWKVGGFLSSITVLLGLIILTQVNPGLSYYFGVLPALVLIAAGSGFLMTTMFAAILGSAPTSKSGSVSGILNTIQQFGSLVGIALISTIALEYRHAFIVLSIFAIMGVVAAFFVKNRSEITSN